MFLPVTPGTEAEVAKRWLELELGWEIKAALPFSVEDHDDIQPGLDELNAAMFDLRDVFVADPTPIVVGGYTVYPNERGVPKYREREGCES